MIDGQIHIHILDINLITIQPFPLDSLRCFRKTFFCPDKRFQIYSFVTSTTICKIDTILMLEFKWKKEKISRKKIRIIGDWQISCRDELLGGTAAETDWRMQCHSHNKTEISSFQSWFDLPHSTLHLSHGNSDWVSAKWGNG